MPSTIHHLELARMREKERARECPESDHLDILNDERFVRHMKHLGWMLKVVIVCLAVAVVALL